MFDYTILNRIGNYFHDCTAKYESSSGRELLGQKSVNYCILNRLFGTDIGFPVKFSPQCFTNSSNEIETVGGSFYHWTEVEQGHIIGSYYYGYLAASLFINTILNTFSPQDWLCLQCLVLLVQNIQ